jgi:hypothetical protein
MFISEDFIDQFVSNNNSEFAAFVIILFILFGVDLIFNSHYLVLCYKYKTYNFENRANYLDFRNRFSYFRKLDTKPRLSLDTISKICRFFINLRYLIWFLGDYRTLEQRGYSHKLALSLRIYFFILLGYCMLILVIGLFLCGIFITSDLSLTNMDLDFQLTSSSVLTGDIIVDLTTIDKPADLECVICMDLDSDKSWNELPICHHKFHGDCISEWINKGNNGCPICRNNILTTTIVNNANITG